MAPVTFVLENNLANVFTVRAVHLLRPPGQMVTDGSTNERLQVMSWHWQASYNGINKVPPANARLSCREWFIVFWPWEHLIKEIIY